VVPHFTKWSISFFLVKKKLDKKSSFFHLFSCSSILSDSIF